MGMGLRPTRRNPLGARASPPAWCAGVPARPQCVAPPWVRGRPARPQRRTPLGARASRNTPQCTERKLRNPLGARASPPAYSAAPHHRLTEGGFWGSPCVPSSVSGIRMSNLPLLPVWEKGAGGMRGKRRGNAAHRASRSRTPPLRAITGARARRHTRSRSAWVRGRPARMVRGRGAIPVPSERATTHRSAQDARR